MAAVNVTFPGNLAQVKTAADLRSVPSTLLPLGALFLVNGLEGLFEYDPGSLAPDDGKDVLRPADKTPGQVGRWIRNVDGLATGPEGPTGPANSTYTSLAALKAAPQSNRSYILADGTNSPVTYAYVAGDFTGRADDVNVVKLNDVPLTTGALVRQTADSVTFQQAGTGAVARTSQDKARESLSVRDFGAVGDGVTNDRAAFLACYNACVAQKKAMRIPAGVYRAWLVVTEPGFVILGDGSGCTTIKIPDGATHTLYARDYNPPEKSGVPCVIDYGQIGDSNGTPERSGGHISGLTLDGNVTATAVPTSDLFGWGLAFTAWSGVTYSDVRAKDCHCGGIGTFINSNYHVGNAIVSNCGHSVIDAAKRPGFDVNSSKFSSWDVVSYNCPYGVRVLDNCRNNVIRAAVRNAGIAGFVLFNQSVNPGSWNNDITVAVTEGCSDYAFTLGPNNFANRITVLAQNIQGSVWRDVTDGTASHDPSGNSITIVARIAQRSAVETYSRGNDFDIIADQVNAIGPQGVDYAVNVYGSNNRFWMRLMDVAPWKSRGVAMRAGSSGNTLVDFSPGITGDPYSDAGMGNVYRYYVSAQMAYDPPSLADKTGTIQTLACPGARLGMFVQASFSLPLQGMEMSAYVANEDVVQVRFQNETGGTIDLGAGTLKVVAQSA